MSIQVNWVIKINRFVPGIGTGLDQKVFDYKGIAHELKRT